MLLVLVLPVLVVLQEPELPWQPVLLWMQEFHHALQMQDVR
jgi:hypothetical protein